MIASKIRRFLGREGIQGYLYISPWLVGVTVFFFGPMVASLILSFTNYSIISRSIAAAGFNNYLEIFHDKFFWKSLRVTLYYLAVSVPLGQVGSLTLALLIHQKIRFRSFFRTALYLPSVTPIVAAAAIWLWFLQPQYGLMNAMLALVGIKGPPWLSSRTWAVPGLALVSLWGIGGPRMIIYLAGLQGIPEELKEAARIDGANTWQVFARVTIPHLSPTIFFNLIIHIIGSFQQFSVAYIATEGGPDNSTLFYVLYLYRNAFNYFRMGYASALAWIMLLILLVFTLIQFRGARRWVYYGGKLEMSVRSPDSDHLRRTIIRAGGRSLTYLFLLAFSVVLFMPILWAFTGSLKSSGVLYTYPPQILPREWRFANYVDVFRVVPFLLFARNSFFITAVALFGQLLSSSLVAYGFSRFKFRGRNVLFIMLLSTMMLPPQVILIPRYLLFATMGWIDTYKPLILPFWFGHAFSVFLLRQFFMTIPKDFDDAATIDGAGSWKIFWRILLPLIKPALIAIGIFGFQWQWNSFITPLIYLNSTERYTLQLGLSYIKSNYMVDMGGNPKENWLMAASLMVSMPTIVIFFLLQRYFVRGVVLTGLKQ